MNAFIKFDNVRGNILKKGSRIGYLQKDSAQSKVGCKKESNLLFAST